MTTAEFLAKLRNQGMTLWFDGDRLRYRAPKGMVTPSLKAELAERKPDLRAILRQKEMPGFSAPVKPMPRHENSPLSQAQQRIWFISQLEPDSPAYNIPEAIRLSGPLNVAALNQSFNEIIRRHEVLRTACAVVDGRPVAVISPHLTLNMPVIDLREHSDADREAEILRRATAEAQHLFNLAQAPLLRTTLLWIDKDEYVLLMTLHHLVADGWSMGILYQELSILYDVFDKGNFLPLPKLTIQYADFTHWQLQQLQGELLETQLTYWKRQLADAPTLLELPMSHSRPPIQTFQGASRAFTMPLNLFEALKALSRQEGVTLFMTLLAAFQTLLHRYTSYDNIVVGTTASNRNHVEVEKLIGSFANNLVLRTHFSGEPSFRLLLNQVREMTMEAYAHQDIPYEKLVEELQPERDLSRNPLFQVLFILHQHSLGQTLKLPGISVSKLAIELGTTRFDLSVSMVTAQNTLTGTVEYSTDLFDAATIERMTGHYQRILGAIVSNPDQSLSELPLLTEAERQQIVVEWNENDMDYPRDKCIHELFEACTELTPDVDAVVFEGQRLTYLQLNSKANQLARHLIKHGAGPEVPIGICVERSLDMIVGLMGILKSGGAYVPLDPLYPHDRLSLMIEDAGINLMVTHRKLNSGFPESKGHVVYLDDDWENIAQESDANLSEISKPDSLAYIMFTSGSTGRPKGVMITHHNVIGFLSSYRQVTLDGNRRIGTCVAPFSFDTSTEEIYANLCFGGTLHIIRPENSSDTRYFADYLIDNQITTTYIVPDFLPGVAAHLENKKDRFNLQCVITGLRPKKQSDLQFIRNLSEDIRILNAYGPTEVTYGATAFEFTHADDLDNDTPIGKPFPNYKVYIVDSNLQPVPIGVAGELLIGGVGLARGYLNRPELTSEKFIPDPFSDEPESRLYRSGDLVRYRSDGNIEFLGRIDDQMKIRGFRVEPGEIEKVLERHPDVENAVVVAAKDRGGDSRLVVYVVPRKTEGVTKRKLRDYLKTKLPDYMIPSAFVLLDALPLMPNGKVDRGALPEPVPERFDHEDTLVGPRTPIEELLANIWGQILGLPQVGIHDNFFELGGHSLLATQIISRIRDNFAVELPLRSIFEHPSVEGLGEALLQRAEDRKELEMRAEVLLISEPSEEQVNPIPVKNKEKLLAQLGKNIKDDA